MISNWEVIETNHMIEKENLDVRTITIGISLLDCIDSDLDKLNENIYNKITLCDIVRHTGKSGSTVKSLFALYRSEGIMHYYNSLKIKEARKLIREGNYNISQISDLLHFDNPQYFSKCFKRFTNMTPREYQASIMK